MAHVRVRWSEKHESRLGRGGFGTLRRTRDPRPPGCTSGTKIVRRESFEPWRISHTGNVYTRVFYKERNEKWYPLDSLRNEKLAEQEQEIARELWAAFLAKMTCPPKELFGK